VLSRIITSTILVAATVWLAHGLWSRFGSVRGIRGRLIAPTRGATGVAYMRALTYLVATACVAVLALTGFVPFVLSGAPLDGFALVLHVLAAPVFAVSITLLILLWAHDQRFDATDRRGASDTARKACFWLILGLTPVILGSIMLMMYPVFATPGQEVLRTIHFSSALAFLLLSMIHARLSVESPEEPGTVG